MQRVDGWEARLSAVIEREKNAPFTWGSRDCATFAADCLEAITGREVLGPLRGSYASRMASRARMRARGWQTMRQAAAGILEPLGALPVPPRFAHVGDIGVTACGVLCVRIGDGFACRDTLHRLAIVHNVEAAWAIGRF